MNCSLCGHTESVHFAVKEMEYDRCCGCGSVFLCRNSRLPAEGQVQRYTLHENSLDQDGYRSYLEKFLCSALSAYKEYLTGTPSTILDYGSGPEPCLVQLMQMKNLNAFGWDPFFNDNGLQVAGCPEQFDMITCLEVAEHFEQPEESFLHLAGLVKKGGLVVVGTNLVPEETRQPFATWWYRFDPTHVTLYSLDGLKSVAAKAGLQFQKILTDKTFAFIKL